MSLIVTVTESVTDVTVTDDVTNVTITESPTIVSEQVAGVQGAAGTNGTNGQGFLWRGAWATATVYAAYDVVRQDGSSYRCSTAHTSSSGTQPGIGASWAGYWSLMAQKGDTGNDGAQGSSGIIGVDSGELTNTGTSSAAQLGLATVGTSGTYTKVTTDSFGRVSSGTTLSASDIPSLDADKITTGNLAIARGGTGIIYGISLIGRAQLMSGRTKAANSTAAETFFWNDANTSAVHLAVDADTTYFIEGHLVMSKTASSVAGTLAAGIQYTTNGTTTLTEQSSRFTGIAAGSTTAQLGTVSGTAANTLNYLNNSSSGAQTQYWRFWGFIRTHATTAGKLNLIYSQEVNGTTTAMNISSGSYMNVYKMGTGSRQVFGDWS